MSVLAIILTYASPETAKECVRLVLGQERQPDHVLVIDNASPVPVEDVLEEAALDSRRVTVLRTSENLGPAGGYATGLQWFVDSDHDAAWVMDDDCLPDPGALGALEERAGGEGAPTVVFPHEVDGDDGRTLNNPSWCGVWLPRDVVAEVGLPRADFFWWMEDTEYFRLRMRDVGVPVVREHSARVVQGRARRDGKVPVWKVYYETRNSTYVYTRFHWRNSRAMRRWAWRVLKRGAGILLREDLRAAKLGAYAQGLIDGLRGHLGKRFPVD